MRDAPNDPLGYGPNRPRSPTTSPRASPEVLAEIDRVETEEARNRQLTREMHEFFSEASRSAAKILSELTDTVAANRQASVSEDVTDFLNHTVSRAQDFVEAIKTTGNVEVLTQDLETTMTNLVDDTVDEIRADATAEHRAKPVEQVPIQEDSGATAPKPQNALLAWFVRLNRRDTAVRGALKLLVQRGLMTPNEARAIYALARMARR